MLKSAADAIEIPCITACSFRMLGKRFLTSFFTPVLLSCALVEASSASNCKCVCHSKYLLQLHPAIHNTSLRLPKALAGLLLLNGLPLTILFLEGSFAGFPRHRFVILRSLITTRLFVTMFALNGSIRHFTQMTL